MGYLKVCRFRPVHGHKKLTPAVPAEGVYFSFPSFEDFCEDPEAEGQLEKAG
jgi:hypothetical protein